MTETIDISKFRNTLVLHYGGEPGAIDIRTMTISISHIYKVAELINAELNPGSKIAIRLNGVAPGSSKIGILLEKIKKHTTFENITIGVLTLIIAVLARTDGGINFKFDPDISIGDITIGGDKITIQNVYNDTKIVCPKEIYNGAKEVFENDEIKEQVLKCLRKIANDEGVFEFGLAPSLKDKELAVRLSRTDIEKFNPANAKQQTIEEDVELDVIQPVVKRGGKSRVSKKRWEFLWRDRAKTVKAPIQGPGFYDEIEHENLTFGGDDKLRVTLAIRQKWNYASEKWEDTGTYQVIEVLEYTQGAGNWRRFSGGNRPYG